MAERHSLEFERRELLGKKVNRLRRAGVLPATVYGKNAGPYTVQLNAKTFSDLYRKIGRTTLVDLKIPDAPAQSGFVHAVQRHPVTRAIMHVDFRVVDLLKDVTVDVPLHVVGESPVVKRGEGVLNQLLNTVSVRALPTNVPSHVEVDISVLDSLDKSIHAGDITAPAGATVLTPAGEVVVTLAQARVEQEEEQAVETTEGAEPSLVREEREEEQTNAEEE